MKRHDRCFRAQHLHAQVERAQIHKWRLGPLAANFGEDLAELRFNFGFTACSAQESSRLEHGRVLGKEAGETIPIKIIEGLNELIERLPNLRFGALVRGKRGAAKHQYKNECCFHFVQYMSFHTVCGIRTRM